MTAFPHTVTLLNTRVTTDPATMRDAEERYATVLCGVLLQGAAGAKAGQNGRDGEDVVTLYIPFSVLAADAATGENKQYIEPHAFWALEDRTGYWTLSGRGGDRIVKDGAEYTAVSIERFDYGALCHWRVILK